METIKLASTRLRRELTLTHGPVVDEMGNNATRHAFQNKDGKTVAHVDVYRGRVTDSLVDDKYRSMGLGKKIYGEAMKANGGKLKSDNSYISGSARSIWERMKNRPDDYKVTQSKNSEEFIYDRDPDLGRNGMRPIESIGRGSGSIYSAKFKTKKPLR